MIFADVLKYVFLVLGALLVFISYWLAAAALLPGLVDHARENYGVRPFRITILGLLVGLPLVIAGLAIAKVAPAGGVKLLGREIPGDRPYLELTIRARRRVHKKEDTAARIDLIIRTAADIAFFAEKLAVDLPVLLGDHFIFAIRHFATLDRACARPATQ